MDITGRLFELQDIKFRDFNARLIPSISKESIIGVKTPTLKKLAAEIINNNEADKFLKKLPHKYFGENQLHAFIISEIKDFGEVIIQLESFLPYVDNWATCDQLIPKVFKKNKSFLKKHIELWLNSEHTYTLRFGIGMIMRYFLDDEFNAEYMERVSNIRSSEYYVNMMLAWYFATALAKQYDTAVIYIKENRLDAWVHNKAIQKARESYRVSDDKKEYLKSLKR